jgi:predicted dehydrogenase
MLRNTFVIIGCGLHYRECYHQYLQQRQIQIALVIDLKSQEQVIRRFFAKQALQPKHMVFLDESFRNQLCIQDIQKFTDPLIASIKIDAVLISTEPKVRKVYFLWAVEKGFPVFMDKPISAFSSLEQTDSLLKDYQEMVQAAQQYEVDAVICCERRSHEGHVLIREHLRGLIEEIGIPITGINIHFAGGIWNLPQEYSILENHPFKYGYGILLHSGYHYVDLLSQFLELNHILFDFNELEISLEVMVARPIDQVSALGQNGYRFFGSEQETVNIAALQKNEQLFGETDVVLIGQVCRQGSVLTNFSIQLLGTSLSLRQSPVRGDEIEGRVRQEQVIVHMGPFCSVTLSSYSFKRCKEGFPKEFFSATIFQSPLLTGKSLITTINQEDLATLIPDFDHNSTLNVRAKKWQLAEFLEGRDGCSSIQSHYHTIQLLHLIYSKISELHVKK